MTPAGSIRMLKLRQPAAARGARCAGALAALRRLTKGKTLKSLRYGSPGQSPAKALLLRDRCDYARCGTGADSCIITARFRAGVAIPGALAIAGSPAAAPGAGTLVRTAGMLLTSE